MAKNCDIELRRQSIQDLLDSKKNHEERNVLGQFSTPKLLADSIVKAALSYINGKELRFLDTSIGTGVFFSSLINLCNKKDIEYACGYEIDKHYAIPAIELWKNEKINYFVGDFFDFVPPKNNEKFNIIVSNPPYVRHHHINSDKKSELKKRIEKYYGLTLSGLTGLYGYFMILSALWLKENGISVWLVPNEFLDVNYGKIIKSFFLSKVKLLRIHRFNPLNIKFSNALVTSTVVFYTTGKTSDSVLFTSGDDIIIPEIKKNILVKNLNPDDKWSNYFLTSVLTKKNNVTIGDYFYVKRGIATGSNKHFIINDEVIGKYNISEKYLKPILPSPKYIMNNIIEKESNGRIAGVKNRYLLNITCSENEIYNLPDGVILYLNSIYKEIKNNYIIKNRSPWYKQEYRPECPFLISYMGRNPNEPFRLFLNKTNATAPNVYLFLYPKFNWKEIEVKYKGFLIELHNKLLNISSRTLVSSGRVYGGGLYKLEPKELMGVSLDDILSKDIIKIIDCYVPKIKNKDKFRRILVQKE